MNYVVCLPSSLSCDIINVWIELNDISRLDTAFCIKKLRSTFLGLLSSTECVIETDMCCSSRKALSWLMKRKVKVKSFFISRRMDVELGIQYVAMFGPRVTTIVREGGPGYYDDVADLHGIEIIEQICNYGNLVCVECFDLPVALLRQLLTCNRFLRRLCFSISRKYHDVISIEALTPNLIDLRPLANSMVVMHLISLCPNLKILDLRGYRTHLTDADLLIIARQCRHLKSLALRGLDCSAHAYTELSKLCSGIEILSLVSLNITDEVIGSVAVNLKHLRRLNLQSCKHLTNLSLNHLAAHCASTLELLWLCRNAGITSEAVIEFKGKIPSPCVQYHETAIEETRVPSIYDCTVCTVLTLFLIRMLSIVKQCKTLQVLGIFPSGGITEKSVDAAVISEIVKSSLHLHTIVVYVHEIPVVKKVLNSIGSDVRVIRNDCKENEVASLIVFPL